LLIIEVDGQYASEVTGPKGIKLETDATIIVRGKKTVSGLARYCNENRDWGPNVAFCAKGERVKTWGIKVLPLIEIRAWDEFFVSYGDKYW